ncbi:MAG: NAD(P)-dependent oxidoreductase [Ktedonobacterales bacterium]
MKIAVYGAGGRIGQRIVAEALRRGHQVTAVSRTRPAALADGAIWRQGDALDAADVVAVASQQDVIVSAIGPSGDQAPDMLARAARALTEGITQAWRARLVVVGGAGSLEVAPGERLMDTPDFPAAWRSGATAHAEALDVYRASDANWTYLSPADKITPGERSGAYRLGGDQMVVDAQGQSHISMEDYAVALLDEIESPRHIRQRFTVGY